MKDTSSFRVRNSKQQRRDRQNTHHEIGKLGSRVREVGTRRLSYLVRVEAEDRFGSRIDQLNMFPFRQNILSKVRR